jgi:hypothetical protein
MSHRPKESPLDRRHVQSTEVRPSTAPTVASSSGNANSLSNEITDRGSTLEQQKDCEDPLHRQQQSRQSTRSGSPATSVGVDVAIKSAMSSRRPQSARPILQSQTSGVLQLSWQAPPGIGRPGSASAAAANAAPRRRQRPQSSDVRRNHTKLQQQIKASPPQSPRHKRPQSAQSRLTSSGFDSASPAPARRIMARHRRTSARPTSAATGKAKARIAATKFTAARRFAESARGETRATGVAEAEQPQRGRMGQRPSSARPVLESYAFAARA